MEAFSFHIDRGSGEKRMYKETKKKKSKAMQSTGGKKGQGKMTFSKLQTTIFSFCNNSLAWPWWQLTLFPALTQHEFTRGRVLTHTHKHTRACTHTQPTPTHTHSTSPSPHTLLENRSSIQPRFLIPCLFRFIDDVSLGLGTKISTFPNAYKNSVRMNFVQVRLHHRESPSTNLFVLFVVWIQYNEFIQILPLSPSFFKLL